MSDRAASGNEGAVPVVSVPAGEFLFRAGDAADSFFIIISGQIELLRRDKKRGRLALLTARDLCGEDSAFEGQARAYDARAVTSSTLLRVEAATFLDLVRVRPDLAGAVISWTASRLLRARAASLMLALPRPETIATAHAGAVVRFVHVESGLQFPLPAGASVVAGRADPASKFQPDLELSSADTHRSLSRRHAVIARTPGGYTVTEQPKVANGTFVNGERLSPGEAVPITDGDEVAFGLIATVFRTT